MRRACVAGVVLASLLYAGLSRGLSAHSALRFSNPLEGVALGDTPSTVQLTFTEAPEPALSEIHVIDRSGLAYDVGPARHVADDPLSMYINVRQLPTGIYTVNWRVVSAIDGHATEGAYAFGVRQSPAGTAASGGAARVSALEVTARWALNVGLVLLIGAAFGDLAKFAGLRPVPLPAVGLLLAAVGLALLAGAQPRSAGMSIAAVLQTSVGRTLTFRAAALVAAGLGLIASGSHTASTPEMIRRAGVWIVLVAGLVTVALQMTAGHAFAAPVWPLLEVGAQWAHVVASGLWLGGLAVLLLGNAGAPTEAKARAVARFSTAAGAGILIVLVTGAVRAFGELTSWSDFTSTTYGRTLLVKIGLVAVLAVLGAANRRRGVPAAAGDLRPLRRLGSAELVLAVIVAAAGALLATLPPPGSAHPLPGIVASGVDFGTTVRVSFSAVSNQPGPNRFAARVADYDTRAPVEHAAVRLRFRAVDDPGVAATSLALDEISRGEYGASGANLAFDGRWQVTVQVQRGAGTVEIPVDVEVTQPPLPVEVQHWPNAVNYNALVRAGGFIRFSLDPERAGRSRLSVSFWDMIQDERAIGHVVITQSSGSGPPRALPFVRVGTGRFAAEVELVAGRNTFAAVASTTDGTRLRAWVEIQIPRP